MAQPQTDEEKKKAEEAKAAEAKKKQEEKDKKAAEAKKEVFFFKNTKHAGLTVQVQKMVKQPDNSEKQEVAEQERFTEYYDLWKGDVVRVGYLRTESPKIAKLCREDGTVDEIDEKEYLQAVEGDDKHEALKRAPVAAS